MAGTGSARHLGLDLGGTNVKSVVVEREGDEWRAVGRAQEPTAAGGPDGIVPQLVEVAVRHVAADPAIASIGVGVPGLYDPERGTVVFLPNVPGAWLDRPVAGPVGAAAGRPTVLINDARAFCLAELRLGAGRGARTVAGFTLGTGVGGAIAVDGRVHQGEMGRAGELGHQTLDPDGPLCNCGNRGCLEAYARADQIVAACGTPTVEAAVEAARGGDERARRGLADVGRYLGIGIANIITILTPERVILGGGVSAARDLLLGPIQAEVARRVTTTDYRKVEIVTAELGVWAGAMGAAVHGAERAEAGVGRGHHPAGGGPA